jgi:hypothetical protein
VANRPFFRPLFIDLPIAAGVPFVPPRKSGAAFHTA